ncbi:50S ribosomal protein L6 [Patescibacteria group bacterium]|nr:50S ribosomal protein L6 [Patescibacteria group bacterium]MBU1448289.1 50S ribosomal protein L6 [Patescibacteria group bacterium]MBU2613103.1 50S ribosomal protein L6 [Patescibacteria group bacterium]
MSRIGKKPVLIPAGVEATVAGSVVTVKGPKGTITVPTNPVVTVTMEAEPKALVVDVKNQESPGDKALWGLTRQLLANAVDGVQKPFEKTLEFVGIGFRVSVVGRDVNMEVGFSHPVMFHLPDGVEANVDKQFLTISGIEKQAVGEVAAQIRRVRPPEPYKGKGIRLTTETVRRKAGKTAAKAGAK